MISVVFDCGVIVSAIGWGGNPQRCLILLAHRQLRLYATRRIWDEYETRLPAILRKRKPDINSRPMLDWLLSVAHFVEPAPLGKPRSRDIADDPYLECALAGRVRFLVSNDRDLLDLEKPFGISIVTPVQLLLEVRRASEF